MKFIWLAVIVLSAVLVKPEASGGFGYELIISALESIQSDVRSLKDDLRSVAIQSDALAKQCIDHKTKMDQLRDDTIWHAFASEKATNVFYKPYEECFNATIEVLVQHESRQQYISVIVEESRCPQNGNNGMYQLKLPHSSPFEVYCENGWIVIHRRFNGSLDFNQTWVPYREGFGNLQGEHWLGLEKMHQITRVGSYELKLILKSFDGVVKTAKYDGFKIGSEIEQYQLNLEKFVQGDAGDSFMHHDKMKFSTSDHNNDQGDRSLESCAEYFKSGWWFKDCLRTNLNGLYVQGKIVNTMSWWHFNNDYSCLKEARMLIRAVKLNE